MKRAVFNAICVDVANGSSVAAALREHEQSFGSFYRMCDAHDANAEMYARARETRNDRMAEDTLRIADDHSIDPNARRVMVDTRKWLLSKLVPKKYGDKLDLNVSGSLTTVIEELPVERSAED